MILNGIGIIDSIKVQTDMDEYLPATAIYSVRKVRSAYTGNCIRIRRSTDNAEFNIGFNSNGLLDIAEIQNLIGANSAFVVRWYDQSGNTRTLENTVAAEQPNIVNSGTLRTVNGLPCLRFDSDMLFTTGQFFASSDLFASAVVAPNTITSIQGLITSRAVTWDSSPYMGFQTTNSPQTSATGVSCNWGNRGTDLFVYTAEWDESVNQQLWANNVLRPSGDCAGSAIVAARVGSNTAMGTNRMTNSSTYDAPTLKADVCEMIVWQSLEDDLGNRTGIVTNQRNYYFI